jgi:predicted pyridoxine 5'-phosphate oxidase superfamily flavin-nucleotide-binding protein
LQKRLIIIPSGNGHFDVEEGTQEVHVTSDSHIVASNSDIVFPPAARRAQAERNSARLYAKRIAEGFPDRISPELAGFIAGLDTAFLATVSAAGAPYIQHRGGPKGFIKMLDERTLGFADYAGNRQYITISNLAGNDHAYLFLLDFAAQRRIKIWGHARVVENDPALLTRLADPGYRARPERAILFTGRSVGRELHAAHHRALYRERGGRRHRRATGADCGPRSGECATARARRVERIARKRGCGTRMTA